VHFFYIIFLHFESVVTLFIDLSNFVLSQSISKLAILSSLYKSHQCCWYVRPPMSITLRNSTHFPSSQHIHQTTILFVCIITNLMHCLFLVYWIKIWIKIILHVSGNGTSNKTVSHLRSTVCHIHTSYLLMMGCWYLKHILFFS
jgi:hypothetical protein